MAWLDGFERQKVGAAPRYWSVDRGAVAFQYARISTAFAATGGYQSLELRATASASLALAMADYSIVGDSVKVQAQVMAANLLGQRYFISYRSTATPETDHRIALIKFANDGLVYYWNTITSAWVSSGVSYSAVAFKTLLVNHDFHTQTWSAWYDQQLVVSGMAFINQADSLESIGFGAVSSGGLYLDNVQIGAFPGWLAPQPPEGGGYLIAIGPYIFATGGDLAASDYNIDFGLNEPGIAWAEVEAYQVKDIMPGDLMLVGFVPFGGSSIEQFFYGQVQDILPSSPERVRILAKDALDNVQHLQLDTVYYQNLRENLEVDITAGATKSLPAYAVLPDSYASINKPLIRVQAAAALTVLRPDQEYRAAVSPNISAISLADGYRWIGSAFRAEYTRFRALLIEGAAPTPPIGGYSFMLCGSDANGYPDIAAPLISAGPLAVPPDGWFGPYYLNVEPIRFNVGRTYWLVIGPYNPALAYNMQVFSYPTSPASTGKTNEGVVRWHPGTGWDDVATDEIGSIKINYIEYKDIDEDEDWSLQDVSGAAHVVFDRNYRPRYVRGGALNQKGLRAFYTYGLLDFSVALMDILNDMAEVDYNLASGPNVPFIDALDANVWDIIQDVLDSYGYVLRQYHQTEGAGPQYEPPAIRYEPLPSFGSPVLTLKYGGDSADPETDARVVQDNLMMESSSNWTGVRLTGIDRNGRLLVWHRMNPDIEEQLATVSQRILQTGQFHRYKMMKIRNAQGVEELDSIAQDINASQGTIAWTGSIVAELPSIVKPGQTVRYQNSRRGIPLTEFRVLAVSYSPGTMTLTVSSLPERMDRLIRQIQRDLGAVSSLQTLDLSTLRHDFWGYGSAKDTTLSGSSSASARLLDGASPVSAWQSCQILSGPTINGYPSKLFYANFPQEDGDGGHGRATSVSLKDVGGWTLSVPLDWLVFHWADNAVSVCILIYRD